jgi:outer membrane protein assembly factor BamB
VREVTYQQQRTLTAASIVSLGSLLLAVWLLLAAPIAWRVRWRLAAAGLAVVGLFLAFVKVRGVTGDLVPVLGWRFGSKAELGEIAPGAGAEGGALERMAVEVDWKDSPQFLGPNRDAVFAGVHLARDWQAEPPRELWRHAVRPGWSSFAVAGERDHAEQRGDASRRRWALDGSVRWVPGRRSSRTRSRGAGRARLRRSLARRSTRSVGRTLVCRARGGTAVGADVLSAVAGSPRLGHSSSPWVGKGRVVVPPGEGTHRSLVAYDAETGARSWLGGDDDPSYASPSLHALAGVPQLVVLNANTMSACDPADGRLLWSVPWYLPNPNVCQPLVLPGDRVCVSSGYGAGCGALHVERAPEGTFTAEQMWEEHRLKSKFATPCIAPASSTASTTGSSRASTSRQAAVWKDGRCGHVSSCSSEDLLLAHGGERARPRRGDAGRTP